MATKRPPMVPVTYPMRAMRTPMGTRLSLQMIAALITALKERCLAISLKLGAERHNLGLLEESEGRRDGPGEDC